MPIEGALGQPGQVKKIVVQQPQFLPWAGLWHKLLSSDFYVTYEGVKFDQSDHQHRVTVNGAWLTLPVEKGQRNALIKDVKLGDGYQAALLKLAVTIRQTCMAKRHKHRDRLGRIVSTLEGWDTPWMADLNWALFVEMADALGLLKGRTLWRDTKLRDGTAIENLDDCLRGRTQHPMIYLAGGGGLNYMGYDSLTVPVETRFQRMKAGVSPDSVLQLIASTDNPLEEIEGSAQWVTKEGLRLEWNS